MPKQTGQFLIHTYKLSGVRNGEAGIVQTNIVRLYFFQWTARKKPDPELLPVHRPLCPNRDE
jgi:hypothetical protein